MPRSTVTAFEDFHAYLKPSPRHTEAATKHRATIKASLEKIYTLQYFFQSGSSGNATDIFFYSDVDYMAIVPTAQLKVNSTTLLLKVKNQLDATFPRTGVHISTPAVVVPFGSNGIETTEIVPGDLRFTTKEGVNVYEIADGDGGWIKTAPKAHNSYVTEMNKAVNFQLKTFIRFLRAWKYYNDVKISSFYLEMRAAKYAELYCFKDGYMTYAVDLYYFFKYLSENNVANLQDPTGIVGLIAPCNTSSQLTTIQSRLATAVTRSKYAMDAVISGNDKLANEWYDKLFNGRFPSYYY